MIDTKMKILQNADKETLIECIKIYEICFSERYQDLIEIAILLHTAVNREEILLRIKELLAEAES